VTAGLLALAACEPVEVIPDRDPGLERMADQRSVRSYDPVPELPGGTLPGRAPAGTTPWRGAPARPPWTEAELLAGQSAFEVFCAPCHGLDGGGGGPVALDLALRPPPSLHEPRVVALSDEEFLVVIDEGYGLMPRYGDRLGAADRWRVTGYVRALQLSRRVELDRLPAGERQRVAAALAGAP